MVKGICLARLIGNAVINFVLQDAELPLGSANSILIFPYLACTQECVS